MRSSSIPRSLILVASAALSFGACATQMDPGGTGAMAPAATGTMAGSPAAAAAAGTTGGAAGKPAGATTGTAGGSAAGPAATGTAGKPAGAATAGGPATATGTAGTPAASGAAGAATAAAGTSGGAAGGAAAAGGAVTFTMVYEEVLTGAGCAVGLCHGSAMAASKLGLADKADAYMQLVGIKAMGMPNAGSMGTGCMGMDFVRVKAGDADNSLLVQKLEKKQTCGTEMPPGGTAKPEHVKLVRDWIMAGAKND